MRQIRFENIERAAPSAGIERAVFDADAVIICPSNPFISIGPILAVPSIRPWLEQTGARVIAITPIIAGRALKGPAADMLGDLGHEVSALGVARVYCRIADVFVLDEADRELQPAIEALGLRVILANTVMNSIEDKQRLAETVLSYL